MDVVGDFMSFCNVFMLFANVYMVFVRLGMLLASCCVGLSG